MSLWWSNTSDLWLVALVLALISARIESSMLHCLLCDVERYSNLRCILIRPNQLVYGKEIELVAVGSGMNSLNRCHIRLPDWSS